MAALDHITALFEYNEWANGHVLDAASGLSQDELERSLRASFDSVQGNLWHVLSAQTVWLTRWRGGTTGALPSPDPGLTLAAIREAYAHSHNELRAYLGSLNEAGLDRALSYTDTQGERQQPILWRTMLHVVNHGTHHRAETAMLLTSMGHAPRQLDYVFYELERAGGKPRLA